MSDPKRDAGASAVLTESCHARVGLLGNPSDIYGGRALALSLKQFEARVTLTPNDGEDDPAIYVLPGSEPICFEPPASAAGDADSESARSTWNPAAAAGAEVDGGKVLMTSMVSVLRRYCALVHIDLARMGRPSDGRGFTLRYETTVPFQLGLSGSSAIICACLRCLVRYYGLQGRLPKALLPNLVLKAEKDLGTVAGYMDRVIQVYGGLVYMDFNQMYFDDFGHGAYDHLNPSLLPDLYLMFDAGWRKKKEEAEEAGGHSGKIHSNVRQRWLAKDAEVVDAMNHFADIAARGRQLLLAKERGGIEEEAFAEAFAALLRENFGLRRAIFGDQALGGMVAMAAVAEAQGAAAKLTGSGGALVVFCPRGQAQAEATRAAAQAAGYTFMKIEVADPTDWSFD